MKKKGVDRGCGVRPLFCTFLLLAILTSCTPSAEGQSLEPTDPAAEEVRIGLLLSGLTNNSFYLSLQSGAIEAASRLDVQLIVRDAGDDPDRQIEQIADLLALGVDALIVHAVDSAAVAPAVDGAGDVGVPVFTMERRVPSHSVVSHVASDNIAGGEMAAGYMAEALGGQGSVAELLGMPGTSAAQDRGSGFDRVLGTFPGIEIVARQVAGFDRRQGQTVFAGILRKHPGLDGVFAHNDEMILGAIDAAQEAGRADHIIFVGFDAIAEAVEAMEDGRLAATIAQQPTEMGRLSVEMAVRYLRGETIPDSVTVDLALISR